jgi:hypothetical protein
MRHRVGAARRAALGELRRGGACNWEQGIPCPVAGPKLGRLGYAQEGEGQARLGWLAGFRPNRLRENSKTNLFSNLYKLQTHLIQI